MADFRQALWQRYDAMLYTGRTIFDDPPQELVVYMEDGNVVDPPRV